MSLDWSVKNVANWDEFNTEENFPYVEVVIFDTMAVGINEIKESNIKEFRRRQLMARTAMGYSHKELQDFSEWCSVEFLTKLIGLKTNASTETVTAFNKKLISNMESRIYTMTH